MLSNALSASVETSNSSKLLAWWIIMTDFHIKPTLQSWDKSLLLMTRLYLYINMWQHYTCFYFVKDFWVHVHEKYWSIIFLKWLFGIIIRVSLALWNKLQSVPLLYSLWKSLRKIVIILSLNVGWNMPTKL